jgi:hypothetical protein
VDKHSQQKKEKSKWCGNYATCCATRFHLCIALGSIAGGKLLLEGYNLLHK